MLLGVRGGGVVPNSDLQIAIATMARSQVPRANDLGHLAP